MKLGRCSNWDEFVTRLLGGPTFLLLGQDYLALETGEDPFLKQVACRYDAGNYLPLSYTHILDKNAALKPDEAIAWMLDRCLNISTPKPLETISGYYWNGVYTSAFDDIVDRAFRSHWRQVQPILDDSYRPRDPRNRQRLHITHLYGGLVGTQLSERPPLRREDLWQRQQMAVVLANRLAELVTPLGTLVIEGYSSQTDWFSPDRLYAVVSRLGKGQTHMFSSKPEAEGNQCLRKLVHQGKLVAHRASLAEVLHSAEEQGHITLHKTPEDVKFEPQIRINSNRQTIPLPLWAQISGTAHIIVESFFLPLPPQSKDERYRDFRHFLFEASYCPPWEGYTRGFAFEREFERDLRADISKRLRSAQSWRNIVILSGQTGTGKTVALGRLAFLIQKEGKYPVLFIERCTPRVDKEAIDRFCQWAERNGASPTLVVWDGMRHPDEYYDLLHYLQRFGRKTLLLGSCYRLPKDELRDARVIVAPDKLNEKEIPKFVEFLGQAESEREDSVWKHITRLPGQFLVSLHRLLSVPRAAIRRGVEQGLSSVESVITRRILNTGALARWAASHPKLAVGGWVLMLVAGLALMTMLLSSVLTTESMVMNNPESKQADTLLSDRLGASDASEEIVIIRSPTFTVDDAEFRSQEEKLFGDLMGLGSHVVLGGLSYHMTGAENLVSADRHTTIMLLEMPPDVENVVDRVHKVVDDANQEGAFEVLVTGEATLNADLNELSEGTWNNEARIGVPTALVILALVFGAVAAALLPIALGIAAVVGALGLTALVGQAMNLSFFVEPMIIVMGLAVGIDYSLFILSRYREERGRGLDKIEATAVAGATAGRSVLFSGMMVVLALFGLVIFPLSIFLTIGIGAILAVAVAVVASLTLLPAILGLLGDRVNAIRIPFVQHRATQDDSEANRGFWAWMTRAVTRWPVITLVVAAAVLVIACIPYLDVKTGFAGISDLPDDLRAKKGFVVLQNEFGFGLDQPAVIVVDGQTDSQAVQTGISRLQMAIGSDRAFVSSESEVHAEENLSVIRARLAGDPDGLDAMDAVARLRSHYVPEAFAGVPAKVLVTGETAYALDFNKTTGTYTPIVLAFVLALSFVCLTIAFRSIVVPAMSILMNLLSVGAAYGLIVLVFQKGVGASLFGFEQVDVIEFWVPLFLFAVLFGLSMDYHVFLLSRMRERFNRTGNSTDAVSFGIRSTGRLITGAALIMVAVFMGIAIGAYPMFQQMGFGLAVAVLLDATIVRSVLVPSAMRLLGSRAWYMPKWLEFVPNVAIGEPVREQTITDKEIVKLEPVGEIVAVADSVRGVISPLETQGVSDLKNTT